MSLKNRWQRTLILLIAAFGVGGCGLNRPDLKLPANLRSIIPDRSFTQAGVFPIQTNGPHKRPVRCLVAHKGALFLGTDKGIYRSNNQRTAWSKLPGDVATQRIDILVSFGEQLLAVTSVGQFSSSDMGNSWHLARPAPVDGYLTALVVIDTTLLGITQATSVSRSEDGGKNWVMAGSGKKTAEFMRSVTENQDAYLRGARLRYKPAPPVPTSVNSMAILGTRVYTSLEGELFVSVDLGKSWQNIRVTMPLTKDIVTVVAVGNDLFVGTRRGGLFRKDDSSEHWQDVSIGEAEVRDVVVLNGDLFAATNAGVFRSHNRGVTWTQDDATSRARVFDLLVDNNTIFAATSAGMFLFDGEGAFKESNAGLFCSVTRFTVTEAGVVFALTGPDEYRQNGLIGSRHEYESYGLYATANNGETWAAVDGTLDEYRLYDCVSHANRVFVTTLNGVYRSDDNGAQWNLTAAPHNPNIGLDEYHKNAAIGLHKNLGWLYVSTPAGIFRSRTSGDYWQLLSSNFKGLFPTNLTSIDETVFGHNGAGQVLRVTGHNAETIAETMPSDIKVITTSGSTLYAGGSTERFLRNAKEIIPTATLYKLTDARINTKWEKLRAENLAGVFYALNVDSQDPNAIIAGTSEGLFWSEDGGQQFHKVNETNAPYKEVYALLRHADQLWIGTDAGTFYGVDRIPRGTWYENFYQLGKKNLSLLLVILFSLLTLLVLSTRAILLILQLDIWPISIVAPWFYLTPLGRWKLYRRYRSNLANELTRRGDASRYVDLPYTWSGQLGGPDELLSKRLSNLDSTPRVVIQAEGGRGKTTLCNFLALRMAQAKGRFFGKRRSEPVLIDGLTYRGNMQELVLSALRQRRAYVNPTILESQLMAGFITILFDGFSEVPEGQRSEAEFGDFPKFIRQHPDTAFVITSRSAIPETVSKSMGNVVAISLKDIDESTERIFLRSYLKRKSQVDELRKEIRLRFPTLPRIPLMLRLVAAVYDKTAAVPRDQVSLFAEYAQYVMRFEATGIEDQAGLNFAVKELVRETYLASGGDRGLTVERGEQILAAISNRLANYDISMSPIRLINLLVRAGLYVRVGDNLKFFHDSFESYFAARALETDVREKRKKLVVSCAENLRLGEAFSFLLAILAESQQLPQLLSLLPPNKKHLVLESSLLK